MSAKLKIHNSMWPGLVGKGDNAGQEPPFSLERMLDFTTGAQKDGKKYDGVDCFLFHPHINPDGDTDSIKQIADQIANRGLSIGSLVAPVWENTGGGSAMGNDEQQRKFLAAVEKSCHIARIFDEHGVRKYGVIRVDSAEFGIAEWRKDPYKNTARIIDTFKKAAVIASDNGQRLAAEGEICWAGMHSWKYMLDVLQGVNSRSFGFQADLAHTYLYMMGYNAPEYALLGETYSDAEFYAAYEKMTNLLRPWMFDFHVAQNDGTVHGAGSHDKTGKHCTVNDPNGKLTNIAKCAGYWLRDAEERGIQHICWDGCMFPNSVLETPETWDDILRVMVEIRESQDW